MSLQRRIPVLENFSFQPPVKQRLATPPIAPSRGDRYIVGTSATGIWSSHDNNIVYCSDAVGPQWLFDIPEEGWFVWVEDEDVFYVFNGSAWTEFVTGGTGNGDMLQSVYDPDVIADDVFDQDNMKNGAVNKNYTVLESIKLAGIEPSADVTDDVNVQAAGAVMTSGNQNVAGIKTFGSFPVTPSNAPANDYEVANKKYVDDNAGSGSIVNSYFPSGW